MHPHTYQHGLEDGLHLAALLLTHQPGRTPIAYAAATTVELAATRLRDKRLAPIAARLIRHTHEAPA